jgi:hypothetical protein
MPLHTGSQLPVTGVSWYEAAQFCNYLTSGNRYEGSYSFDSEYGPAGVGRIWAQKNYDTIYFLPTEDEWYKGAYFKPDGSGYSNYTYGIDTPQVEGSENANTGFRVASTTVPEPTTLVLFSFGGIFGLRRFTKH